MRKFLQESLLKSKTIDVKRMLHKHLEKKSTTNTNKITKIIFYLFSQYLVYP